MISVSSHTGLRRGARFKVATAVACLAAALGIAACGGGSDNGGTSSGDTVVLGANTELSGSLQVYGLPAEQGLRLGGDAVNPSGGVKAGGKTYQVRP